MDDDYHLGPAEVIALIDRAERGEPMACITLGRLYHSGTVVPCDRKRAESLYYSAELSGDTESLRVLGGMYLNGDCTVASPKKAADLFRKAAQKNDALSQFYIGQMYREGVGVEHSESKAELWLSRADKNGIRRGRALG